MRIEKRLAVQIVARLCDEVDFIENYFARKSEMPEAGDRRGDQ